jgi:hypothetical protein
MCAGICEDFNKVKFTTYPQIRISSSNFEDLKNIWDNHSSIFKGEDHGDFDRISYPRYEWRI